MLSSTDDTKRLISPIPENGGGGPYDDDGGGPYDDDGGGPYDDDGGDRWPEGGGPYDDDGAINCSFYY